MANDVHTLTWERDGLRLAYEDVRAAEEEVFVIEVNERICWVQLGKTVCVSKAFTSPAYARSVDLSLHCEVEIAQHACGKHNELNVKRTLSSLAIERAIGPAIASSRLPKASVDVRLCLLAAAGSELAVATVAASLALAVAGIECSHLVPAACSRLLDGELTVACLGLTDTITLSRCVGTQHLASCLIKPTLAKCHHLVHAKMVSALNRHFVGDATA